MKKTWITRITKLCNFAAVLAFLSLSGCSFFEEGETCKIPVQETKIWTPGQGIRFIGMHGNYESVSWGPVLSPNLGSYSHYYFFENICPLSPVKLHVKVIEKSALAKNQAFAYEFMVSNNYGDVFKFMSRYPLGRSSDITRERDVEFVPNVNGLLETAASFEVSVFVYSPFTGIEEGEKALAWAKENIVSISIEANFIRYR